MNLVLFEPGELDAPLPAQDPRSRHILGVLRRSPGQTFVAGLVNGPVGEALLVEVNAEGLRVVFTHGAEPPPLPPVALWIGLPRPQTARDILRDATTLGATALHFVAAERTDPNYAAASLWTSGEWRRQVLAGAAQACDTRLPAVSWHGRIATAGGQGRRLALDNYEATAPLAAALANLSPSEPLSLALGPERGWGPQDRAELRAAGFTLCSLGNRVLRLETAVTAALAIAHAARG